MSDPNSTAKLVEALISALMCHWEDNGNVSADSIRDGCITVLAEVMNKKFDEVNEMIEQRVEELQ